MPKVGKLQGHFTFSITYNFYTRQIVRQDDPYMDRIASTKG